MLKLFSLCLVLTTLYRSTQGCTPATDPAELTSSSIMYKNDIMLPANEVVVTDHGSPAQSTEFGQLSGLTYDSADNVWYTISDDTTVDGTTNFPRMYKLKLDIDEAHGLHGWEVEDTIELDSVAGDLALTKYATADTVDPEGVAHGNAGAAKGKIYWLHEGIGASGSGVAVPMIHELDSSYHNTGNDYSFPADYTPTGTKGCRSGHCMESLALSTDGDHLLAGTQQPLMQDGAIPTSSAGGNNRLAWFDVGTTSGPTHEYVYHLDAIPSGYDNNYLTALTAIDDMHFASVETATHTSGSTKTHNVRLYTFTVTGATDVHGQSSVSSSDTPVTKTLVTTLTDDTYGHLGNIQGIAMGPDINGHHSLVMVSDDGFNYPNEATQFVLFEY